MPIFTLTIFLGALLLFQVELIIGKTILPWFGGTSAVWITCMLFFQVVLLAGYAYGHALDRARTRAQTRLHQLLLVATIAVLAAQFVLWHSPLILDASWKPGAAGNPLLQILTLLAVSVGLPYLVLASTAPLLQSWWRRLYPQRSPYPLYAVSNLGSFLGLVSYPFLVEPFLTLKTQALAWSAGYAAFVAGCAYCAAQAARVPGIGAEGSSVSARAASLDSAQFATVDPPGGFEGSNVGPGFSPASSGAAASKENNRADAFGPRNAGASGDLASLPPERVKDGPAEARPYINPALTQLRPTTGLIALWLSLAACASALLLATTNQLCKNVAAVPLLWVLPLAIYLLTFTLCFESDRRYSRRWFHPAFALGTFLTCFVLATGASKNLPAQIAIYSFGLFAACMVCHGELARLKPDPRHLTLFYLVIAAGGVLGGLFVALAAPYLFVGYWEFEVSLWLAALLFLVVLYRDRHSWLYNSRVPAPLVLIGAAALLPVSMALAVGSTQLAGSIPSVVVIVGALFFLQRQARRRKTAPARTAASGSARTPTTDSVVLRLGDDPAPPAASAGRDAQPPAHIARALPDGNVGPSSSPARLAESPGVGASSAAPFGFKGAGFATQRDEHTMAKASAAQQEGVQSSAATGTAPRRQFSLLASCTIVLLVLGATLTTVAKATLGQIASVRNFYGALTIEHQFPFERDREAYALKHGEIFHGFEFRAPQRHMVPTSYFSEDSGLGLLLAPHLQAASPPPAAANTPSAQPVKISASAAANDVAADDSVAALSTSPSAPDSVLGQVWVPHPSVLRVRVFAPSDTSPQTAGLNPGFTQPDRAAAATSGGDTVVPPPRGAAASAAAPLRIGDVGLGIGTVAAYARPGDALRFYEINPQVVTLASDPRYFRFLHDSAAPASIVLGDGRLSLERELAQGARNDYDVLIVDAFNGDAVPVHLLTIEAFELYLQRLKNPGGVLAMNVTNTFLDLRPVVIAAAERLGLASLWVHCDDDGLVSYTNDWVLLSRDRQRLEAVAAAANDAAAHPNTHAATLTFPQSRLWTDDYSNLFRALR